MSRLEELLQQQKEIALAIEVEVAKGRAAAALGEAVAQFNLGLMFEKGQGVAQNYREARRCYKQAAAQGIDFLRPLHSSQALEAVHALLRTHIPKMIQDRYLAPDIAHATALVESGALAKILRTLSALPELWINRNPDS